MCSSQDNHLSLVFITFPEIYIRHIKGMGKGNLLKCNEKVFNEICSYDINNNRGSVYLILLLIIIDFK